jgi:CVNH domain
MLRGLFWGCVLAAVTSPALANSTFPFTCSEIRFAYQGANATIQAVCLKADGSPNATSLVLQGISNENGLLKQGSGPSTFQKSCGTIQILVGGPDVELTAQCRTVSGASNATSLSLDNISNNNGNLVQ